MEAGGRRQLDYLCCQLACGCMVYASWIRLLRGILHSFCTCINNEYDPRQCGAREYDNYAAFTMKIVLCSSSFGYNADIIIARVDIVIIGK